MAQYIQISLDELKRMYPNLDVDSLQFVSVSNADSINTQQQQAAQNTQPAPTHYILQPPQEEESSTNVQQQSLFFSTEVPIDTVQQRQMQPTQQVVLRHVNTPTQQQQQQSQIILQKSPEDKQQNIQMPQQNTTPVLITQHISAPQTSQQHVIVQHSSPLVLQQSTEMTSNTQNQNTPQQQTQPQQIVMRHQLPAGAINQPRIVFSPQSRTVVYNTTQANSTGQSNQQQSESQQNRIVQQPTRQLVVNSQQHQMPNIIFQTHQTQTQTSSVETPTTQQQQQQSQPPPQQQQQHIVRNIKSTPNNCNNLNRVVSTPSPKPVYRQNIRFTSPPTTMSCNEQITPISTPITRQARPRVTCAPRSRAPRANAKITNAKIALATTQIRHPSPQVIQQAVRQIPPLIQSQTQPQNIVNQKRYSPANNVTHANNPLIQQRFTATHVPPRLGTTPIRNVSPNVVSSSVCTTPQQTSKYRTQPATKSNVVTSGSLDLEESIQAVVVTKSVTPNANPPTESKPFDTTLTSYFAEGSDDEKRTIKLGNGRVMPLTEYRKLQRQQQQQQQQQQQPQPQQQQPHQTTTNKTITLVRNNAATAPPTILNTKVNSHTPAHVSTAHNNKPSITTTTISSTNDDSKTIIRSQAQNQQHIIQPQNKNQLQTQDGESQKSARMLVILSNGEQRLITFTLPRESCTVQELLEQVGVPFTSKTNIQCVSNPGANIDYVVTVGISVQESTSELISAAENSLQLSKQQELNAAEQSAIVACGVEQTGTIECERTTSTTAAATTTTTAATLQAARALLEKQSLTEGPKEIPTKHIPGFLAVCSFCGYCGGDHARCERCKRIFSEEPKRIASTKPKPEDEKKRQVIHSEFLSRGRAFAAIAQGARGRITLTPAVRGRGRGTPRTKHVEAEPVILTLSSDDEGDDEQSNKSAKLTPPAPCSPVQKSPFPFEPVIPEVHYEQIPNNEREDVADVTKFTDQLYTSITCRTVRIGTYRYEPREKIFFSSKGIKIVAPNTRNSNDLVVLNIQMREIVKIIAHFSNGLVVIFVYTLPTCGSYIRESIEMKPKSSDTPYYNPTDRSEPYKRIVLQMDAITEEAKSVIRSIFTTTVLEEIQLNEASELLLRSCSKDKITKNDSSLTPKCELENIRQILIYPPGKGGISINTEDYMCLAIDQYLNDVIIDFYLKYLHTNVLNDEQRHKTHIFSSFFYNRLTTMTARQRQTEKDVKLSASQKRHARVKSWTKNVNLFEKDFIIIPINEQSHWFLAIICFPRLHGPVTYDTHDPVLNQPIPKKKKIIPDKKISLQIGNTTITPLSKREIESVCVGDDSLSERDEAEGDDSDLASDESDTEGNGNDTGHDEEQHQSIKQPLILIFDSLSGASRSRVVATLRDYLTCEYRAKVKEPSAHVFNKFNMPGHCVKVPQQNNFTDCGLYLLQYVEQFFKDPIQDYRLPIKQLINWFETIIVTRKREEISNLLRDLVEYHNPDRLPLPEIAFPTINGKLVEQDDSLNDEQAEFEEEDMDEELEEEEEEDIESAPGGDTEGESSPEKQQLRNGDRSLKRSIEDIVKTNDPIVRKSARLDDTS